MRKIRSFLATIALLATLGGVSLQGVGSLASTTSSLYANTLSASSVAGLAVRPVHFHPYGPCPGGGSNDC